MGACCSSPADPGHADSIPGSLGSPLQHQHPDPVSGLVHVTANARAPQPASTQRHHYQHHHHHHHHSRSSRAPKQQQLLRAASPAELQAAQPQPQQQPQQPGLGQHQLLPPAPLQHLASPQPQHNKDSHIVRSSSGGSGSVLSGLHSPSSHSAASTDQAIPLQRLHSSSGSANSKGSCTDAVLSPMQLLAVCAAVVQEGPAFQAAGITPLLLASLCLIESAGLPHAKQHREHLGDTAHGLCQVLLSTAQWLAGSQGFDAHGAHPAIADLENPKTCVYFAAAYLSVLRDYGGSARSEGFVVRAYHAGPKGVDTAAAHTYLQKYLKAKSCLAEVAKAMAVTAAAAAIAAQVQLPGSAHGAACGGSCADAEGPLPSQAAKVVPPPEANARDQSSKRQDSSCRRDVSTAPSHASSKSSSHSSRGSFAPGSCASRQVLVMRTTADLVAALRSNWDNADQATGRATPAAAGGAGGILSHMLPSRWGLSSAKQHTRQPSGSRSGEGALALVPVAAADLCAAWQRLLCISPAIARQALAHAAAAAALAPLPDGDWRIGAADPSAAAVVGAADSTRRSSGDASSTAARDTGAGRAASAGTQTALSPAPAAALQAVASMPCVHHIVGHGETLQRIASVCDLGVSDLLAANPEVREADAVHHNDCIAVPLPVVFPRLVVVQPGDTLHSIARAHEVSLGRVLAKNPELTHPSRLQPGWVVALPGLKGDSQVSLPVDWLGEASLTADVPHAAARGLQEAAAAAAAAEVDGEADLTINAAAVQQQPAVGRGVQDVLVDAVRWGSGGGLAAAGSASDPCLAADRASHAMQPLLPPVGSGAFLFTVGSSSSSGGGNSPSSMPAAGRGPRSGRAGVRPARPSSQQHQAVGAPATKQTSKRMGSSGNQAGVPSHSLELSHSWTVGAQGGYAH